MGLSALLAEKRIRHAIKEMKEQIPMRHQLRKLTFPAEKSVETKPGSLSEKITTVKETLESKKEMLGEDGL